jgi:hypothetical protein
MSEDNEFMKQMLDRLKDNDMFKKACDMLKDEGQKKALEEMTLQFAQHMFSDVSRVVEEVAKDDDKLRELQRRFGIEK